MKELPKGWSICNLSDLLVSLESGSRPKGGVKGIKDGIPSIGGEHLTYNGKFDFSSLRYVSAEFSTRMTRGHICTHDILIVKDGATTGKTVLVDEDFLFANAVVNEHVFICRPTTFVVPKLLARFLQSQDGQSNILSNFQGSAQGGINSTFASNTQLPLPPLAEQKRIVAKLEQLLSKVEACQKRLEKIPQILKRFRQAILAAACSGRLTEDWRGCSNVQSSKNFGDIPQTWKYLPLKQVCLAFQYGTSKKSSNSGLLPVLRMGNLQDGKIDWDDLVYTSDTEDITKYKLEPGDVLFNRTNSPELVGKTSIYRGERAAIFAGYLIRVKTSSELNGEYLNYCLNSCYAKIYCLQEQTYGVSQSNINAQKLAQFEIPLPPLDEQHEIVLRVESLFQVADRIEARYQKAKAAVDRLTQSILAKAFRGELVPQDPHDEPASVLLERIRHERESSQDTKKNPPQAQKQTKQQKQITQQKQTRQHKQMVQANFLDESGSC